MFKILKSISAIALVALTGCSANEDLNTLPDNNNGNNGSEVPVTFGSYLGRNISANSKTTRGGVTGEMNTTSLQDNGFGVLAYFTGTSQYADGQTTTAPNFMYNTKVSTSSWTYSPLKYWPNDTRSEGATSDEHQYVSFFAYAPYVSDFTTDYGITAISANSAASDPTVSYTAKPDANNNYVDLLWGTKTPTPAAGTTSNVNENLSKSTVQNGKVSFTFKHALAKFGGSDADITIRLDPADGFSSTGTSDSTRVTVSSIKITPSSTSNLYETGVFNLATGKWSNLTTGTSTLPSITGSTLNSAIAEPTNTNNLTEVKDGKSAWISTMPTGLTTTAQKVFATDGNVKEMLLIPGSTPSFTVEITYVVRTLDYALAKHYTEVTQTVSKDITLPTLEVNKKYGIEITIGLTSVKFDATVEDWDTGSNTTSTNSASN